MNAFALLSLVASVICLFLGFAVFLFNKRASLNRLFFLAILATFFYSFTTVMMWISDSYGTAYFWNKMGSIWPFFVVLVVHFALVFTGSRWLRNKLTYVALYTPAVLFWLIEMSTDLINGPPVLQYWGYNDVASPTLLYIISTIWSAALPILAFAICFRYYRKTSEEAHKQQRKFVALGFAIPIIAFIITNMILRSIDIKIPNMGIISTSFFSLLVGYAVIKYDLFTFDAALAAENIISTIPDSLILTDVTGKMFKVNKRLVTFLGYKEVELVGKPITLLTADNQKCLNFLKKLIEEQTIRNFELVCKTKSGEDKTVLLSGTLVKSKTGREIGIVCVIHDVTERKKAETELAESKTYFETLFNSMLSGIVVIDGATHQIVDANEAALAMIHTTREEVLGKTCHKFICKNEKGKCPITDLGLAIDNRERILLTANGQLTPIIKSVAKLVAGDKLFLLENFIDISEQKKIEEKLVKAERLASIGELAGQVGHDLRNPLTGIKSGAYFLRKKGNLLAEEDREKVLGMIDNAVEDSNRIISSLVDYAVEMHLQMSDCNMKQLVQAALSLIHVPASIIILDNTSEETKLFLDVPKMLKVFSCIIQNAIEATQGNGTVAIQTAMNGSSLEISFADSGSGIPEDVLPKLFSPLITTKAKGMGMSLAICKRIVDAHGGKIYVESTSDKGTNLKIALPMESEIELNVKNNLTAAVAISFE